jgi:hypothetical protein
MTTYTIYLGSAPIACVEGTECAYAVYRKTTEIAEILGKSASLVWDDSGEEVASYGEEEEPLTELSDEEYDEYFRLSDEDLEEAVQEMGLDECGFDPYAGCYTFDC